MALSKTVLVTGAAGGIGSAIVEALVTNGWIVIGSDHPSVTPSTEVKNMCKSWIKADLAKLGEDLAKLNSFVSTLTDLIEGTNFSAIIHNAAVQRLGAFERLTSSDWHETMAVNLIAPVAISSAFLPQLQSNGGSIIHIGSIHSQLTKPGFTAYAASKAAIAGLTRAMAVELGGSIRVNALEPAAISTPMLEAGFLNSPELKAQLESFHPTGCIGKPSDVGRAILFLLDTKNAFLNGCVLPLGGGIHSRLHDPV